LLDIRILIVDDQPRRYDRFINELRLIDIGRESVDIATSCADARDRFARNEYDLLILDILVPLNPEDEESPQNAIDLLFEIREGELTSRVPQILGVTADRSAAGTALTQFEDWCWTVLDYSRSTDDWMRRALNCVVFVKSKSAGSASCSSNADVAIVCALQNPELSEVLKLPWNWKPPRPLNDTIFVHDGWFELGGRIYSVVATCLQRMGMVATALTTNTLIERLQPKIVAMTGICAGVRGKVNLGDVLFADPAWDFQSGKWDGGTGRFLQRPHHIPAPTKVRSHIQQLRADNVALEGIWMGFPGTKPAVSRILPGPLASGSAVLSDGVIIGDVRNQHQELIGIEMEIYGLYAAAYSASDPQPAYIALKGVCDFADPDKEDGYQEYAAYASAQVLRILLERYADRLTV
jgi:nucleoside phosphorylase/CheY-like chemotaxis protein